MWSGLQLAKRERFVQNLEGRKEAATVTLKITVVRGGERQMWRSQWSMCPIPYCRSVLFPDCQLYWPAAALTSWANACLWTQSVTTTQEAMTFPDFCTSLLHGSHSSSQMCLTFRFLGKLRLVHQHQSSGKTGSWLFFLHFMGDQFSFEKCWHSFLECDQYSFRILLRIVCFVLFFWVLRLSCKSIEKGGRFHCSFPISSILWAGNSIF